MSNGNYGEPHPIGAQGARTAPQTGDRRSQRRTRPESHRLKGQRPCHESGQVDSERWIQAND